MKCCGGIRGIFHVVDLVFLYISCYIAEILINFLTVHTGTRYKQIQGLLMCAQQFKVQKVNRLRQKQPCSQQTNIKNNIYQGPVDFSFLSILPGTVSTPALLYYSCCKSRHSPARKKIFCKFDNNNFDC